jgi:uncharacterized membrane protein (UPF0127 family)
MNSVANKTLRNKKTDKQLLAELRIASGMWTRMKGLLGTKSLPLSQGLWIYDCKSIHTFFMNYAIDCIFLDKKMKVVSLIPDVVPGRLVWPQRGADSVVEIAAGQLPHMEIQIGDELYVGN